jgi:hypothetical protein
MKREPCLLCRTQYDAIITGPCIHRPDDSFPPTIPPPGPVTPPLGGPASLIRDAHAHKTTGYRRLNRSDPQATTGPSPALPPATRPQGAAAIGSEAEEKSRIVSKHRQDADSLEGDRKGLAPSATVRIRRAAWSPAESFCRRHRVELTSEGRCIPCDFGFPAEVA